MRLTISLRLLFALALLWTGPCFGQGMLLTGAGGTKAGASCSDSNATAWVNAVVAASSTVSAAQQTRVCNLIVAMKGHSTWSKLDRMWLYASENATQAKIDIVALRTHTLHGTETFTASQGYAGGGAATDFIDTGWAPSTGPNFVAASASLGYYVRNNRTVSDSSENGLITAGSLATSLQSNAFGDWVGTINGTSQVAVAAATTSQGFLIFSQPSIGAGGEVLYRNGASIGSGTSASGTPAALNMYMGGRNNNGTADRNNADQIAMFFAGGGLTATDVANLSTDFNGGYMTSLGTNVY